MVHALARCLLRCCSEPAIHPACQPVGKPRNQPTTRSRWFVRAHLAVRVHAGQGLALPPPRDAVDDSNHVTQGQAVGVVDLYHLLQLGRQPKGGHGYHLGKAEGAGWRAGLVSPKWLVCAGGGN